MPLYLDEIYWDPAHTKEVHDLFKDVFNAASAGGATRWQGRTAGR